MKPAINPALLKRLALKREGKYSSPFGPSYNSTWGGQPWKIGGTRTWGRFLERPETGFTFEGQAHKLLKLRHTGWYVQHDDYNETTIGIVYRVQGKRLYIAACSDPWNCDKEGRGPCIVEIKENGQPYLYDSIEEAARAADGLAETYAESCREDDRKYQENQQREQELEEAEETLATSREEARAMLAEIRESSLSPALCERLKGQLKALRHAMHSSFSEIAKINEQLASNS